MACSAKVGAWCATRHMKYRQRRRTECDRSQHSHNPSSIQPGSTATNDAALRLPAVAKLKNILLQNMRLRQRPGAPVNPRNSKLHTVNERPPVRKEYAGASALGDIRVCRPRVRSRGCNSGYLGECSQRSLRVAAPALHGENAVRSRVTPFSAIQLSVTSCVTRLGAFAPGSSGIDRAIGVQGNRSD